MTVKRISSKAALTAGAVTLLAAGLAACSSSGSSAGASGGSGSGNSGSSQPALVMESSPETSITQNFNPFVNSAPINGMGADGLVYEPLYEFDLANPSQAPYPWLATK